MYSTKHSLAPAVTDPYITLMYQAGSERFKLSTEEAPKELLDVIETQPGPVLERYLLNRYHLVKSESDIAAAVYHYAKKRDIKNCQAVLDQTAGRKLMMELWMALLNDAPEELAWIGQHDSLAKHIYVPMPCPTRDWMLSNNIETKNLISYFKEWWANFNPAWKRAIQDHMRVEWRRRLIGQSKLYWVLDSPTPEQTLFVASLPQAVNDWERLEKIVPNARQLWKIVSSVGYDTKEQRAAWHKVLYAKNDAPLELPVL